MHRKDRRLETVDGRLGDRETIDRRSETGRQGDARQETRDGRQEMGDRR